jgi:mono/diheme cytochrome c family protein
VRIFNQIGLSHLAIGAISIFAAACSHTAQPQNQDQQVVAHDGDTLAFVQAACGGCHSVEPGFLSPNPEAPRWEDIANREGLSEATLASWLYDAHNYPEMMDFDLDRERAKEIAHYMLEMRSGDYRPLPE